MPAARLAHAQTFTVTSTADTDDGAASCATGCTLRKAIRLANQNPGPDTITFSISGTAPFMINVTSELPELSGGETTINVVPAHSVVLSGVGLPVGASAFGLVITSANNVVRGLVVVGFPSTSVALGGSGISLRSAAATGNVIANNWVGLNADGTSTFGNAYYGVQIDEGASGNLIGGDAASERNVVTGNLRANIAVDDSDSVSSSFISNNQVVGNYIGVNAAGTAVPGDVTQTNLAAGVFVSTYAHGTLIKGNLIGGHLGNSTNAAAGIVIESAAASVFSNLHPQDTSIVGNDIGVTPTGGNIANHNGIRITRGALNTTIGDPNNPLGGRNVIGFSEEDGIQLSDNAYNSSGTQIVGNLIGIARNGTTLATIGTASASNLHNTGIYLGTVTSGSPSPATIIGPANVISSVRRFGIHVRSSGNTIKGNFIGTDVTGTTTSPTSATTVGTVGYSFGDSGIWVENGSDNQIGGPESGDRNVIATGAGQTTGAAAAIVLLPGIGSGSCGSVICSVTATTIQGNYLGVSASGTVALDTSGATSISTSEGLRITNNSTTAAGTTASSNNTVRDNVISGVGIGIYLLRGASNNTIDGNRIGTRASGDLTFAQAIRNKRSGINLLQGTGNVISNNLIAFNGDEGSGSGPLTNYYGIYVQNSGAGANGNTISGNRLVRNGDGSMGSGVFIDGPSGILITKSTTSTHNGDGIKLYSAGSNGDIAAPTLTGASGTTTAATLGGSASCSSGNCTVEVFTSSVSEDKEGPVYLTSATTASGTFTINITGCQRYLTATVHDNASNNTSPFSTVLDSGALGPCADSSFSLDVAFPDSQAQVVVGDSVIYRHSITNNAAVERTFSVVITSDKGWASAPALVTVPASTSASFDMVVSVPYSAQAGDKDTTTVQVFSGTTGSNVQTDITTAKILTFNPATPAVSPGQTKARTGTTLTFTHSVTNTGDLAGTFSVVGPSGSGLPTFTSTPPTGWSVASATLAQTSLAGGASTTLTIVVNTPAGAPAGSVSFSFRIKAGTAQTDPATVDTITVPTLRSFTFVATSPTGSPPTLSRPPGASADFVYTLTNTGNATDSFQVPAPTNAAPLSFTVSPSGSFSLAAGASRTVTVTAQVASDASAVQNDYNFSVTAVAVGGTPPTAPSVPGRVTVTGGGSPQLRFDSGTPGTASAAGGTVTFTGTLTNTGNATVNFTLGIPTVTGSPAGWVALVDYNGSCTLSPTKINLVNGESCTFTLQVTVPAGANGGPQAVTLSATADNSTQSTPVDVTVTATATVNVETVRDVSLSAAITPQTGVPGTVLTYTHTLTNLGNATDSFDIALVPTAPASAGMAVLSPTVVTDVPRNGTRTITLVVTVPSGIIAGDLTFTVTATSKSSAGATASRDDVATVELFDAASLSPGTSKNGLPGTTVTFTHTLTNTGSSQISFYITTSDSQAGVGFSSSVLYSPPLVLNPGETTTISVQVSLPLGVLGGTANVTTVEARKDSPSGTILASATDESRVGNTYDVQITPDRTGTAYPNASLVFTHTVTNIGITADTYTITSTNALFWPMTAVPDFLTLAPGESQEITVIIGVPNDDNTTVGAPNFGRIRVASNTDPVKSNDEAVEHITVGKVIDLVLSTDQARAVTPSSGTIRMKDLVLSNTGNGLDTVDITVLGADGGWKVNIAPVTVIGPRDTDYNVGVSVTVPPDVEPGPTKVITIQARSRFDSTAVAEVRLRFVYIAPEVTVTHKAYLPLVRR
nr:NosD domain-containing protein [Oscillochloris sp. ZM17-4]